MSPASLVGGSVKAQSRLAGASVKLSTQCEPLDKLLEGGIEAGAITLLYGEPASGKTNLCLQAARSVVSQGLKVAYVDTEGVSLDRLRQVGGQHYKQMMQNVLFSTPSTLADQERRVAQAAEIEDAGLIVVDSLNFLYRLHLDEDTAAASRSLVAQLGKLHAAARARRVPVVVTAQVYAQDEEVLPFGGRVMGHIVKTILEFKREPDGVRRAVVRKHRAIADGRSTIFKITPAGLE